MAHQSLRQQSTRPTRSSSAGAAGAIQLRDGKQLPLPPWMSFHHLPEYGIVSSASSASASASAGDGSLQDEEDVESGGNSRAKRSRAQRDENGAPAASGSGEQYGGAGSGPASASLNAYSAPQVSASNIKTKKEIALDSLYPPSTQEIYGHIRYLSEEGMKLVMQEVDDCVGHCLQYSSSARRGGSGHAGGIAADGGANLETLAAEIHGYFDMFQPCDEDHGQDALPPSSWKRDDDVDTTRSLGRRFILDTLLPQKYDPTLLPMLSIKCYPNVLDRTEMTKGLATALSRRKRSRGPTGDGSSSCVCIVRSASDLVQQGHLMTEVLSQCISNDPNGEAFAMELQRQRKRQKSHHHGGVNKGVLIRSIWSWTESLVEWAGFTEAFDSIIVVLEDSEKIPSPTLDSFFTTLASLRQNDGVPISVVVIDSTPGGLGDRLSKLRDPALRGTSGVVARELFVPLPQVQLDIFVNRLFSGKCIPTFLWTDQRLLKQIERLFRDYDNSIVSVAKQLKSGLRRYFSVPGAFVSLLHCEKFTIPNEDRIKWLFGDERCRDIIASHSGYNSSMDIANKKDGHIYDLFWKIQLSYLCHQMCQRVNAIFDLSQSAVIGKRVETGTGSQTKSRARELLALLRNVRQKVITWSHASAGPLACHSGAMCKKLNEYIILVGELISDESAAKMMTRAVIENIMAWASESISVKISLGELPSVQPRRDVARAFYSNRPDALSGCALTRASQIAFQAFQSRVMTLSEWHEKYFDAVSGMQEAGACLNESAFFFAVYELVHCGFIRKLSTGRRKEEAYEKAAIIWGNGR